MRTIMKRFSAFILALLNKFSGLIAIVFSILVLLLITLQGAMFWLNTETGSTWLSNTINSQIKETGYQFEVSGLGLWGLSELKFKNLKVLQEQQAFLTAQNVSLDVGLLAASVKKISLQLSADNIELHALPKSKEKPEEPKTALKIPNIYFNKAHLEVDVKTLSVAAAVSGDAFSTQLNFVQDVDLSPDMVTLDGELLLANTQHPMAQYIPNSVIDEVVLDLKKQQVIVKKLNILNEIYKLDASANYGLLDELIYLNLNAVVENPQIINPQLKEPISLTANMNGVVNEFDASAEVLTKYQGVATRLSTKINRNGNLIKTEELQGSGGDLKLDGELSYRIDQALASGEIDAQLGDLKFVNQFVKISPLGGSVTANAKLYAEDGLQALSVDALVNQLSFETYKVQSIRATLDSKDIKKLEQLKAQVDVTKAQINNINLKQVNVKAHSAGTSYAVTLNGSGESFHPFSFNGDAQINSTSTVDVALQSLEIKLAQGIVKASGVVNPQTINIDLDARNLKLEKMSFADLSEVPVIIDSIDGKLSGTLAKPKMTVAYNLHPTIKPELKAQVKGQTNFDGVKLSNTIQGNAAGNSEVNVQVDIPMQLALQPFAFKLSEQAKLDGSIKAKADLTNIVDIPVMIDSAEGKLSGTLAKPKMTVAYSLHPTIKPELKAQVTGQTNFDGAKLSNTIKATAIGNSKLNAQVDIPMQLALQPFAFKLAEQAPLDGSAKLTADLTALGKAGLDDGYTVRGQLNAETSIGGNIKSPVLNGQALLQNGFVADNYNDIQLKNLTANIQFKQRDIEIVNISAKDLDEKGSIKISGNANIDDIANPKVDISLVMDNMYLVNSKNYDVWLNSNINFKNTNTGYALTGEISPREISIRIPEYFDASIPQLNIVEKEVKDPGQSILSKILLKLKFKAPRHVYVSGRGLDAEFQGNLDIIGNLSAPLVKGELKTIRGRFDEFGRRFALDKVVLRFQGAVPPSPYLDVEVSTKVEGIKAKINLADSVLDPDFSLSSEPALPEDEILSLILFGRGIENISTFQALQLANTLRKFSGKGGGSFDPLQKIQEATGLDDIYVDGVGTENTRVGAGKYITDKVYLEVEQGSADASGQAKIQIEVTPDTSIESTTTEKGEAEVGIYWQHSY